MRKALVDSAGNVANIIVTGPGYTPPPGLSVADVGSKQKEGRWDGKKFVPAPVPPSTFNAVRALLPTVIDAPTQAVLTALVNALDPHNIPDETL